MQRDELVQFLDEYLKIPEIKDYGPQGLQIEGRGEIHKIIGAVDAHLPVVETALARGADMLLVHHGIFWGGPQKIAGGYGRLVRAYIQADLNLYAALLALDAHPEVGNNAQLARRLGLEVTSWWGRVNGVPLAALAESPEPISFDELTARYRAAVGDVNLVLAHGPAQIHRVGILSGFGAREIEEAASLGCDAFITGETSHAQYYDALNFGMNVLYGGHYTSETVGVQALGQLLVEKFGVAFEFVDLPTGL
ncbi:MAG: Nif3-like dinuclear metal center hexameric protein [Caldilineaceae bacterium]|nr:Nif3-like dinuclear metal center hexameric protein [Caldilineaceae bacterium]